MSGRKGIEIKADDLINAAIESTAKVRRLQFQGEEDARSIQRKAASQAAEAGDPQGRGRSGDVRGRRTGADRWPPMV